MVSPIAQHNAAAPTKTTRLSLLSKFESQFSSILEIDLGGINPVAKYTILQISFAWWQSKRRCVIDLLQLQKQHFKLPFLFFLVRLSFVRITPLWRNKRRSLS